MMKILYFLFFIQLGFAHFSKMAEYSLSDEDHRQEEIVWEVADTEPFDELIFSWNAPRTATRYSFFVSLRQGNNWSPWLFYGDWGSCGQFLVGEKPEGSLGETYRGVARPKTGTCNGFKVQIVSSGIEKLAEMKTCWACLSNLAAFKPEITLQKSLDKVLLEKVVGQSLITLRHPRYTDMSMTAAALSAVRYLSKREIGSNDFSEYVVDGDFDSYDHWSLHAAEAFHRLGGAFRVRIERLNDFSALHAYLKKGCPVLVNILGTPFGSLPWPPYRTHVLCIIGYDPDQRKVHCIDPVFPNDKSTQMAYSIDDFLRVWAKRQNIACVFDR